jgi:hypothetical protein
LEKTSMSPTHPDCPTHPDSPFSERQLSPKKVRDRRRSPRKRKKVRTENASQSPCVEREHLRRISPERRRSPRLKRKGAPEKDDGDIDSERDSDGTDFESDVETKRSRNNNLFTDATTYEFDGREQLTENEMELAVHQIAEKECHLDTEDGINGLTLIKDSWRLMKNSMPRREENS